MNTIIHKKLTAILSTGAAFAFGILVAEIMRIPEPHEINIRPNYALIGLHKARIAANLEANGIMGQPIGLAVITSAGLVEKCKIDTVDLVLVSSRPSPTILLKTANVHLIHKMLKQIRSQRLEVEIFAKSAKVQPKPCAV